MIFLTVILFKFSFRDNFLIVDIFFAELSYSKITQRRAFTAEELLGFFSSFFLSHSLHLYSNVLLTSKKNSNSIGNIGGFMGLLLGASVLTVFELIDLIIYNVIVKITV